MNETAEDIASLQAMLDRSIERAGDFLRRSFQMPGHSLSAERLVAELGGRPTVALATVTARGEPRVAPVGAIFYRAHFYIPTTAEAARAKHVSQRPTVSLTYFRETGLAIIAHGSARIIQPGDAEFTLLDTAYVASGGESVLTWGAGVYLWIEPDVLYTYAR